MMSKHDFAEEMRRQEIEIGCEFSQDEWENALLSAWKEDRSLSSAIARASKISGLITHETWDRLFARARTMKPALGDRTSGRNRVRVWIAQNARFASDALFDGDPIRAKKLLRRGGKAINGRRMNIKKAKQENNDLRGVVFVEARELGKKHDWNTCK